MSYYEALEKYCVLCFQPFNVKDYKDIITDIIYVGQFSCAHKSCADRKWHGKLHEFNDHTCIFCNEFTIHGPIYRCGKDKVSCMDCGNKHFGSEENKNKKDNKKDNNIMEESDHIHDIRNMCIGDINTLVEKGVHYGDSWKKRGGIGAYMNIARKIDRIENQCKQHGYDIFKAAMEDKDGTGIMDDLKDLSCYLLLFRSEIDKLKSEEIL